MGGADQTRDRRRAALTVGASPRPDIDYLIGFDHPLDAISVAGTAGPVNLNLRYVPDRDILPGAAWTGYADSLAGQPWPDLESLATTAFDDLINELVPRWLCLKVSAGGHIVVLQDQQPNWQNPGLLAR